MKHAWLSIDPGITTGWALLGDDGKILATSVWGTDELQPSLDQLIRAVHAAGTTITAVVEKMPPGVFGELARKLERVRATIMNEVETVYELPVYEIAPGEWKPSRVAKTTKVPWKFTNGPLVIHQKDAIRMGRYAIDKLARKS